MSPSIRQPAEWEPHEAVWTGWPSDASLWGDDLGQARAEVEDFIRAILFSEASENGTSGSAEAVRLVARGREAMAAAEIMRGKLPRAEGLSIVEAPIGDIWLRDTGPIFMQAGDDISASAFRFNGWGGKYQLPEDDHIADIIAEKAKVDLRRFDDFICEGGALETDGEGTFITTRQCLLNPNRNPSLSQTDVEKILRDAVGAEKVIWLDEGLAGDHTDGHVDNIARFLAPGKLACMQANGDDDPNKEVFAAIEETLRTATDAQGRTLEVVTVPSPGRVELDGEPAAASHLNFYIANRALIMPAYGRLTGDHDACLEALQTLERHGPRRNVVAIDSSHLLTGGGSFHCISQQQPQR